MEPPWTPERFAGWLTPKSFFLLDPAEFPGKDGKNLKTVKGWKGQPEHPEPSSTGRGATQSRAVPMAGGTGKTGVVWFGLLLRDELSCGRKA